MIQKLADAIVRTLKWMQGKRPEQIMKYVPKHHYAGSGKTLYAKMLSDSMGIY